MMPASMPSRLGVFPTHRPGSITGRSIAPIDRYCSVAMGIRSGRFGQSSIQRSNCLELILHRTEARENRRKLFGADVEVFANSSPQHCGGDVAAAALLLRLLQDHENDAFAMIQSIADIGQHGLWIVIAHG